MCSGNDEKPSPGISYYHPSVKCCSYTPDLPNFLVGEILLDAESDPVGRQSVVDRLEKRVGVSPLALKVPPEYALRYGAMASEAFGKAPSMRCPHYLDRDGGLCGIWRHRNSICSTWFCKFVRGRIGEVFWLSLRDLLEDVERTVSLWAARQMGLGPEAVRELLSERLSEDDDPSEQNMLSTHDLLGTVDPKSYQEAWGDWAGREAEFYKGCAQAVEPLEWSKVEEIGGGDVQARASILVEDFTRLRQRGEVPQRLKLGSFEIFESTREAVLVDCGGTESMEMSRDLMRVLPYFNGDQTKDILAVIAETENIEIDEGLLHRLLDYGLLKG
jgi:hypothetical protein